MEETAELPDLAQEIRDVDQDERVEDIRELVGLLQMLGRFDQQEPVDIFSRNIVTLMAVMGALMCGFKATVRVVGREPVAYIQLPTGRVAWPIEWHTDMWDRSWDGYSATDDAAKQERIRMFVESVLGPSQ